MVFIIVTSCWVECWGISCIYWYMVEGFLLWCVVEFVRVFWGFISVRVWCLFHVRVIKLDHDCIHMYDTWLEIHRCTWLRNMYDDVCIGHSYILDTVIGYGLMWYRQQSVWVSRKVKTLAFWRCTQVERGHVSYICKIHYK